MKNKTLIILSIVFIVLILIPGLFINKKPLIFCVSFLADYFKKDLYKENLSLKMENEELKAQVQKVNEFCLSANSDYSTKPNSQNYIPARIFSSYPLNFKNIISIDKGENRGIKKEMIAVWRENILVGKVEEVSEKSSIVKTLFDSSWQIPVKIGEEKINGLFKGGNDPQIELIEKPVKNGDPVFVASKEFLLGLKIGEIKDIKEGSGGILHQATVKIPYNISEIELIYLIY